MSNGDLETFILTGDANAQSDVSTLSSEAQLAGGVVWTGDYRNDYYTGTEFDDSLDGGGGNDFIWGGAGNDTLIGSGGANFLDGGEGSDTYRTAGSWYDTISDTGNAGTDTAILTGGELTLPANAGIEVIVVENSNANMIVIATGDASNNIMIGHDGTNRFNGGAGADTLKGGKGWDDYYVNSADDVIVEAVGEGNDTIYTSVSYVIADSIEVEELKAAEGTVNINLTGNASTRILVGNAGNNILDGGAGADFLTGGAGDDTYIVDNAGDYIKEFTGEGTDTLISTVDYALNADNDIEIFKAADGTAGVKLTGNGLDNLIIGNAGSNSLFGDEGADTLIGGDGADVLEGGNGNDTYHIDAADVVNDTGGIDTLVVSFSYTLASDSVFENVYAASGTAALSLTGNSQGNILAGNAASNVLNGGLGADRMEGGLGNDLYYVDNAGDRVTETSTGGMADTVYAGVSHTLAAYVEKLYASGSSSITLTGNSLANSIKGNAGANKLNGLTGKDTLYGGAGRDIFQFTTKASSANIDKIVDYNVAYDSIQLDNKYFTKLGAGSATSPKKLASSAFWGGTKAHDANDRLIYDKSKGYLYYDADGTGSSKQVLIATFSNKAALKYSEFYVI